MNFQRFQQMLDIAGDPSLHSDIIRVFRFFDESQASVEQHEEFENFMSEMRTQPYYLTKITLHQVDCARDPVYICDANSADNTEGLPQISAFKNGQLVSTFTDAAHRNEV